MPVEVIDFISPKNNGSFPTHDASYGKGGYRSVADVTARDAIPAARRSAGMLVRTNDTGIQWVLASDLTTWAQAESVRQDLIDAVGDAVDLYVDPSGDDANSGLSYGDAFATIQAAIDAVPNNMYITHGKRVRIHIGAGTYDSFFVSQRGVYIRFIGDRRTPLQTWAALSVTFSLVTNYANRSSAAISAWVGTVDETTHWMEGDWTSFGDGISDITGAAVLNSTSPNLHVPGDGTFDYSVGIHPFVSIISCDGWVSNIDSSSRIELVGLSVTSTNPVFLNRAYLYGTKVFINPGSLTLKDESYFYGVMDSGSNSHGGLILENSSGGNAIIRRRAIVSRLGNNSMYGLTVKGSFTSAGLEIESYMEVRDVDFETQRQGFTVRRNGLLEMLAIANGIKIQGAPTRIMTVQDGSLVKLPSATARITGAIPGVPMVITAGTVINAKACCNTFLTNSSTPGNEVTVGGNAVTSFASLPTTDLALGNTSTLSRAT